VASNLRRRRFAALAFMIAMFATLLPVASVFAAVVSPATGGSQISADEFGTSTFTTITGPAIGEGAPGELGLGTTEILNIPAGFKFNPGVGTRASVARGATCWGRSA